MSIQADKVQNSIGQMCPMPIAYLAKNMRQMQAGQVLEIQADDEGRAGRYPGLVPADGERVSGFGSGEWLCTLFCEKGLRLSPMAENKTTLVVFSGDMDKIFAAFTIATGAAAAGMDTVMFFTFWGIKAIQKGSLTGKGLMGKMLGVMNRGGIERIGPSRFNFGGVGRWMFKKMMSDKRVATLTELRQLTIDLGVHFVVPARPAWTSWRSSART